jgi:hypothetical protein
MRRKTEKTKDKSHKTKVPLPGEPVPLQREVRGEFLRKG